MRRYISASTSATSTRVIHAVKNLHLPSCKDCIHYSPNAHELSFASRYSHCKKFGEKNLVTGKIAYDSTDFCRNQEEKCGKEGTHFEADPQGAQKQLRYNSNVAIQILLWVTVVPSAIPLMAHMCFS